jgi:hypothetical protein
MQTMFYSQEQYDEYRRDLQGDGFTNEYQRASFQSWAEHPPKNETAMAYQLAMEGKWVVMYAYPYYCRVTSAILGEEVGIYKVCDSLAEAAAVRDDAIDCSAEDGEIRHFLYLLPEPKPAAALVVPDFDDELPF